MTLLIETGLTRFKYGRLVDRELTQVDTLIGGSSAAEPPWASSLARLAPTPRAVFIANGASPSLRPRLAEWIRRAWHIDPTFIKPDRGELKAMPIERYLALVAARARRLNPCLIVTADVTIGIDLISADGRRAGAWTLPGDRPMREALYAQTSGIAAAALLDAPVVEGGFGVNTAGAVQEGARLSIASLIVAIVQRQDAALPVIATGRYAIDAVRFVESETQIAEHLSLEGQAHLVNEGLV